MKASAALIRQATADDLEIIADLRWRLQMSDNDADPRARKVFVDDFKTIPIADGLTHWLAFDGAMPVGVMSVQCVGKVPSPATRDGRWGYLTNCYVLPSYRDTGLGKRMLATIRDWAIGERYEMLVVWPSDRSYAFYERSGFARRSDPLTLALPSRIDQHRG
jgi:GNAT superfamily N-acetyltransferase